MEIILAFTTGCLVMAGLYVIYKEVNFMLPEDDCVNLPIRIDATYISQSPNTFYGMYLYYNENDSWRYKMRSLEEANVILQLYGIRTKLPARYDSVGYHTLIQIATEADGRVVFEFNDGFDVS